ncbi:MAG TPA: 2-phospho-L-lactate transferase [Sporichthyaceae bacterium]|jgi:LPPG:FO 2-phospho-L-lactate transferase|nr:2-phospho-L-lactate transferase [Sporichthyaceae bacterium]
MRIVGLGGGIGAARLWQALLRRVDPAEVTIVVNTGDDLWIHGLRVCPDLDTVLYALTDRQDPVRGWGLRDETWRCMAALRSLGGPAWFNLGDTDLATHLYRTGALRTGRTLSQVTADLSAKLGLRARLLPMTDEEVETHVLTDAGEFHYEEFYIPRGATDVVRSVEYRGAERARPAPGILEAVAAADLVVLGPSNPLASIGPILAVPGMRAAVAATTATVVGVTPIVSGTPITDPGEGRRAASRAALLAGAGLPHTATSAARLLCDVLDVFVLDTADAQETEAIAATGSRVVPADTLLTRPGHAEDLVDVVLDAGARGVATAHRAEGDR